MMPSSEYRRHPDFQIEISSVEHPSLLAAVIAEADSRNIRINRATQGGGLRLLTDAEVVEFLHLAHANEIELFVFTSPRNSFEPLIDSKAGDQIRGESAFVDAIRDLERCADLGIDGVLIADVGLLAVAGAMIQAGKLGALKLKTSVAIAPLNAASAELYARLGASSINVSGSSPLDDLIAMRSVLDASTTIDVYLESMDDVPGGMRYREAPALVTHLKPVVLKFGLKNAPRLYPYGVHLAAIAESTMREKVRRAQIAMEELVRSGMAELPSPSSETRPAHDLQHRRSLDGKSKKPISQPAAIPAPEPPYGG
jgi:hypothetical protein